MPERSPFLHYFWLGIAVFCLLLGLATLWLPLPLGLPSLAVGLLLLIRESYHFRNWLRHWRQRSRGVDEFFDSVEEKAPEHMGRMIEETDPKNMCDRSKDAQDQA